ncbi:MAG: chromosome segregation protein SMC [Burkholderiaceae bacterium]|nr:chromosome segregation protein SMC [Burkholderiaceae bacterium]
MRLKQIKLSGFKSFVDPTSFDVPSQLVGVVGPNGCGKSNIMDAVRWVLGESKASELRGESMQDVIFNGSADRKPSSRASVELVFDNSLGRIGGSWAGFAEISVKRVLGRDGQSTYLINNQVVRRRDVHDMFLGTGLGPRAYAIIGQGMISRIIEARPEEVRVFLEEAAGVSKYKERRRETENRLGDTRENLTRVEDILRELQGQIERLERQAEVAQKYRELESDRDRKQRLHWLIRRDEAAAERARSAELARQASLALEARLSELRALEAEIERVRGEHYGAGDDVHAAQGRFYEANGEVSRLEAEIRLVSETTGQLRDRLSALDAEAHSVREAGEAAAADLERLGAEAEEAQGREEEAIARQSRISDELPALELAVREARAGLEEERSRVEETRRSLELTGARQSAAQENLDRLGQRRERLRADASRLLDFDPALAEGAQAELLLAEDAERDSATALEAAHAQWSEIDARRAPTHDKLREAEGRLAQVEARIAAMRQLQDRLDSQARVGPWLERHGLAQMQRLWQRIRIEDGWETAVESVLRERVGAIEVSRLEHALGLATDAPPAKIAFFDAAVGIDRGQAPQGLRPLVSMVRTGESSVQAVLTEWLSDCYVAEDLESALGQRSLLPPGGRLLVGSGHSVSRHAVTLYAADSEQEGVLARQHEIENLEREVRALKLIADEARNAAQRVESEAIAAVQGLNAGRDAHAASVRAAAAARLEAQRLAQEAERIRIDRERVAAEEAESDEAEERWRGEVEEAQVRFEELDIQLAQQQERIEESRDTLAQAEDALQAQRDALREAEREAQEAGFANRSLRQEIVRLERSISEGEQRLARAQAEVETLSTRLAGLDAEPAQQALQAALDGRSGREAELTASRQRLDELAAQLRGLDEKRLAIEREQEPSRNALTELQLREQAARLSVEQFIEQLREAGVDEAMESTLRVEAGESAPKASWLQGEVTRLGNAIAALGPVNLAALDELGEASERKGFLDAQSADLTEAIETLEDAIRKIDRETRDLLQETYDTVNRHFGLLFPQLFGGGEARLILTGDEILDAGIQVMAQPPGKRNSSIHLLSGGEKALTAIALVFALFQLNPAPFCLLDEVDAPLDDANTERYCDMVRSMSDQTQFLFITHNKLAMELAQQLIGVTMQERGVSRIVAVDLSAATQYAEAA